MKKVAKISLILGIIFILVGAIAFVIAMSFLDWNFKNLDRLTYEEHTATSADLQIESTADIKSLVYDCTMGFTLNLSKGDDFSIKYYTTEETESYSLEFDKTSGAISYKNKQKIFSGFRWFNGMTAGDHIVELVVPENIDIEIDTVNLKSEIKDATYKNIDINAVNSNVLMENIVADKLSVDCVSADVNIKNSDITAVDIQSANGDIVATASEFTKVSADGVNCQLNMNNCTVLEFISMSGTNIDGTLSLTNKLSEFKRIDVDGVSSTLKINGNKQSSYNNETGTIVLSADGVNAKISLTTAE